MKLYLVRHGKSNPENIDPEKGLSDTGKKDIGRLAHSVEHLKIEVEQIWHSSKKRAKQTAEIFSSAVKSRKALLEKTGLKPNDPVNIIADNVVSLNIDLMLVGHLPFMSKMASYLLSGDEDKNAIDFNVGTIACFEYDKGRWFLEWIIHPGLIHPDTDHGFRSYH